MGSELIIMHNPKKHSYYQILSKVVRPLLINLGRSQEDLGDYYGYRIITPDINAFSVMSEHRVNGFRIRQFDEIHNLDIERLVGDSYFFRGFKRRTKEVS